MRRTLPPAYMSPVEIYTKTVLPRTLSPRLGGAGDKKSSVRTGPLNETDVFVSGPRKDVKSPKERD